MSKKILLVTDSYLPTISGVTTVVSNYAMELKKQGCKVKILAPYHRDTPSSRELISIKGVTNPFRLDTVIPLSIFTIQSQVEDFAPDVVHIHSPSILGLWARNWAQQTNTRLVITVHGIPSFLAKYLPFSRYYSTSLTTLGWKYWKWFLNPSDVVLAPSQFIVRELKKLKLASKIIKVPFWIEKYQLLARISSHEKNVQFLYFGRLDQDKNLLLLIKAWSMVPQTNKFLTIAGRSLKNQKNALTTLSRKLGCEKTVSILGTVTEQQKMHLFSKTDFFVMPSNVEVQSITTLQAALSGIPVIVADAAALTEIVEASTQPHLKFKPKNARSLAKVISECCENCTQLRQDYTLHNTLKASFSAEGILETLVDEVYFPQEQ